MTTKLFIEKAKGIHGEKYDYSKSIYIFSTNKLIIICKKHGEFKQTPHAHLKSNGCWKCGESYGEKAIRMYLEEHNIEYKKEKSFIGCLSDLGGRLRYDFYLPNLNVLIEFHGKQHFEKDEYMRSSTTIYHDKLKFNYAKMNNITLIVLITKGRGFKGIYKNVCDELNNTKQINMLLSQ